MNIKGYKSTIVEGLTEGELDNIQSLAEGILDGIATIKAGIDVAKGFVLGIDDNNNVEILREVTFNV